MAAYNPITDDPIVVRCSSDDAARPRVASGNSRIITQQLEDEILPNRLVQLAGIASPDKLYYINHVVSPFKENHPNPKGDMSPTQPSSSNTLPSNNHNDNEASTREGAPPNTPSILLLPPELIIHIFSLLSPLTTLPSLIRTAKPFAQIWHRNALSIARNLLAGYFAPLLELVRLQSQCRSIHVVPENAAAYEATTTTTTTQLVARMFANERIVSDACARFGAQLVGCGILSPPPPGKGQEKDGVGYFSELQRERFHAAYYRYWVEEFDRAVEEGGLRHGELDLRSLFIREVILRRKVRRRGREVD
ncbi:MAG: hypothetical protein Q9208_001358 [Pyrenodesmia sp. 3 TL-2023]